MNLTEAAGFRADGFLIQCLDIKLPWYDDDKIVGLLGFSIYSDSESLGNFATSMASLLATGILGSTSHSLSAQLPTASQGSSAAL